MHGVTAAVAHLSKDLGAATTAGCQRSATIVARRFCDGKTAIPENTDIGQSSPESLKIK